ncbi:MAG: NADH-quinone oxidoreductase subunit F [Candidatus Poribacteria bacterium]|nr:MAG: NADH-quinone oxidoreductase subunit F [Candidatus Poribacteria bacterium]
MTFELSPERQRRLQEILAHYSPNRRDAALLPALHLVQEQEGEISPEAMEYVAQLLRLAPVRVLEAVTFYSLFFQKRPAEQILWLCRSLPCRMQGCERVLAALVERFGLQREKSTPDGKFALYETECLAACDHAPVMMANETLYGRLDPEKAIALLEELNRGISPPSSVKPQLTKIGHPKERWLLYEGLTVPDMWTLRVYREHGGYRSLDKLFQIEPEELIRRVTYSGLRGRGGAGFSTGRKWSFVPKDVTPRYLCANADESEPGTFSNRYLLEYKPHLIIEGIICACWALQVHTAYIYVRGEFTLGKRRLEAAVEEAYEAGFLGKDILGSGFDLDIEIYSGAGAYICGEETALIESIEGRRGQPRSRPPFPATRGLFGQPTVVQNVETLSNLPLIVHYGADWYRKLGVIYRQTLPAVDPLNTGTKLYCISGHVNRPGVYEAELGLTARELIALAGGVRENRTIKAIQIGGPSGGCLPPEHLDAPLDFGPKLQELGAPLGAGGIIVFDDTTCMVDVARSFIGFFMKESCGKCTPCRFGTWQMYTLLDLIAVGRAYPSEIDLLEQLAETVGQTSLCGLGQAAPNIVKTTLKYFRQEYEAHVLEKRCPTGACEILRG